ncbi:MAG: hypothetical protein LWW96_13535 [Acidovorax sp.]|uniref:hypothetical protein n=1 Tax=Acidovorax sp. TaxID=1872122 RepID=UPI0025C0D86A|nr:hypothetical protein [Acidovorax sp.]MCE1193164.1 hypothetical protein [Acidovorax sp.]
MTVGTVVALNRRLGLFIVRIDAGPEFAVFELVSNEVTLSLGCKVQGALHSMLEEVVVHLNSGERIEVVGQSGPLPEEMAYRLLG